MINRTKRRDFKTAKQGKVERKDRKSGCRR